MAQATKTFNPLHFEDLDAHRFEDLVRQLIYDFRTWRSLEATGRLGSDDGYDARGFEIVTEPEDQELEEAEEESGAVVPEDRLWQIQCKREKTITPGKIEGYLEEMIPLGATVPYGVIFTVACDFSKKTRDKFRGILLGKGVQEFYLWGKAELEDLLVQPKNDHLLYGYFGISLVIRKRTIKSRIKSLLAIKRKAVKHLGPIDRDGFLPVLVRDSNDTEYPFSGHIADFKKRPRWKMYYFVGHTFDGIRLRVRDFPAYRVLDSQTGKILKWDYTDEVNLSLCHEDHWNKEVDGDEKFSRAHDFLDTIPKENQAFFEVEGVVPYDRIMEIDPLGDTEVSNPHVYVDVINNGFFDRYYTFLKPRGGYGPTSFIKREDDKTRVKFFPKKLPKSKPIRPAPWTAPENNKNAP